MRVQHVPQAQDRPTQHGVHKQLIGRIRPLGQGCDQSRAAGRVRRNNQLAAAATAGQNLGSWLRAAVRSILSELFRQKRLVVVDSLELGSHRTKDFVCTLGALGLSGSGKSLVVTDHIGTNLRLASRNLPFVEVCDFVGVNPVSLLKFDNVLVTLPIIKRFEEILV